MSRRSRLSHRESKDLLQLSRPGRQPCARPSPRSLYEPRLRIFSKVPALVPLHANSIALLIAELFPIRLCWMVAVMRVLDNNLVDFFSRFLVQCFDLLPQANEDAGGECIRPDLKQAAITGDAMKPSPDRKAHGKHQQQEEDGLIKLRQGDIRSRPQHLYHLLHFRLRCGK